MEFALYLNFVSSQTILYLLVDVFNFNGHVTTSPHAAESNRPAFVGRLFIVYTFPTPGQRWEWGARKAVSSHAGAVTATPYSNHCRAGEPLLC